MTDEAIRRHDAYMDHHWGCLICIAGGAGRGLRCSTGAKLWAAYTEALD